MPSHTTAPRPGTPSREALPQRAALTQVSSAGWRAFSLVLSLTATACALPASNASTEGTLEAEVEAGPDPACDLAASLYLLSRETAEHCAWVHVHWRDGASVPAEITVAAWGAAPIHWEPSDGGLPSSLGALTRLWPIVSEDDTPSLAASGWPEARVAERRQARTWQPHDLLWALEAPAAGTRLELRHSVCERAALEESWDAQSARLRSKVVAKSETCGLEF